MISDWITVVPAPGRVKETAQLLLSLAVSPHDVRTANAGNEFVVPPYLAALYNPPAPKRRRIKKEEVTSNGNGVFHAGPGQDDASDVA